MSLLTSAPTRRTLLATSAAAAAASFALRVTPSSAQTGLRAAQLVDTLEEGQAAETALGPNTSALTYWVSKPDGWHVVTTVDTVIEQGSNAEQHAVVRFSGVLQPGESQRISVPLAIGERQQVLRIRRLGDEIEVGLVPDFG